MMRFFFLAALMWCGHAYAAGCGPDAPPADAATFGLTCEVFHDSMTSATTFDTANTRAPGFNWYPNSNWTNVAANPPGGWVTSVNPTAPSDYTIGPGGLVMNPATNNYPISMWSTCTQASNSAGYTGTVFQGSFYVEIAYSYTGSPQGGTQWAALWMEGTEFLAGGITSPNEIDFVEMDLMESPYGRHLLVWDSVAGAVNQFLTYAVALGGSPNGTMVIQPSDNDGTTGFVKNYTAGVLYDTLQAGPTIVPIGQNGPIATGSGAIKQVFTNHYCLFLTTGPGQPLTVTSVKVWMKAPFSSGTGRGLFH